MSWKTKCIVYVYVFLAKFRFTVLVNHCGRWVVICRGRFDRKFLNTKSSALSLKLLDLFSQVGLHFFINVFSCHTCPGWRPPSQGDLVRMNGSLSLPCQAFLISSSPPLPSYSPLLPSSSLSTRPTFRPPYHAGVMRPSIHVWLILPVLMEHPHIHTWYSIFVRVTNAHQRLVNLGIRRRLRRGDSILHQC